MYVCMYVCIYMYDTILKDKNILIVITMKKHFNSCLLQYTTIQLGTGM